jgi:tryptophan synthase beta chain
MVAYDKYNKGELEDYIPTDEELQAGFGTIPHIPGLQ